jgi:hypothetical protein
MRWISGGPDLPPNLLQALEDGRLVFFCGAGISYPAGLPTFRGLVEAVYQHLGQRMEGHEQLEFEKQNYDRVFGLLERRMTGTFVRRAVIQILGLPQDADLPSHRALLALGTSRERVCRLVTTNFDRGFEHVAAGEVAIEAAPRLSVPKLGSWNCVVHLHGIINERDPDGRSLVLTSADFGAAYLTERWASRFVGDLFRRFTVLFVGYSVEDPVIRYMMDAFAADRALGEGVGPAYVLAGANDIGLKAASDAWEAKGVIPILYDDHDRHAAVHLSLAKWAEAHRSGLFGKESIVRGFGSSKSPSKPFADDPEVSQLVWAISEPSGRAAQVFSQLEPLPPIEWLEVLATEGLLTGAVVLMEEHHWTPLVDPGYRTKNADRLHPIALALCVWLARHLDSAALLEWIYSAGASLHPEFQIEISRQLAQSPALSAGQRAIWEVLAADPRVVWTVNQQHYRLIQRLSAAESWSLSLRNEILGALAPRIALGPSIRRRFYPDQPIEGHSVAHFAEADIVIAWRDHGAFLLENLHRSPIRNAILLGLLDDLTSVLKQAMELFEMVEKAGVLDDPSYIDQPSISPHDQNTGHRDWTALIELLRDSWLATLRVDREAARRIIERWRILPYPVFRRMSLFAMAESDLCSPSESQAYLLERDGWWLWSPRTSREKFRLLRTICTRISGEEIVRLTSAILGGLPRSMLRDDISEEQYLGISERGVWLRLAKLQDWGCQLPEAASEVLRHLSDAHATWRLSGDDRDEFPVWMEESDGEPPIQNEDEFLAVADDVVIAQLAAFQAGDDIVRRKWRRLVSKDPKRASQMIAAAAEARQWPSDLWEPILQGLKSAELDLAQWRRFMEAAANAPEPFYQGIARYLAWFLQDVTSRLPLELDALFWTIWDRVQPFAFATGDGDEEGLAEDPIARAINLPSGLLAEGLLDRLAKARPRTAADVSNDGWARLTGVADGLTRSHTYARVIMAARLAWLYHLNSVWCESHLRKHFDWGQSSEAIAVWQGFLWQASLNPELWRTIKTDFMIAFSRKAQLGPFKNQIASLFGFICIDREDWLTAEEMQNALRATDVEGRAEIACVLFRRLQGAGDQGEVMWSSRIGPWFELNWPKDRQFVEPASAFNLAMAAAYAGEAFPAAVNAVGPFLTRYEHYSPLIDRLIETDYPERHSESALRLLDVLDTTAIWVEGTVRTLLNRLDAASPNIRNDPRFRHLDEYLRERNLP